LTRLDWFDLGIEEGLTRQILCKKNKSEKFSKNNDKVAIFFEKSEKYFEPFSLTFWADRRPDQAEF
jgi:hypothetical protein